MGIRKIIHLDLDAFFCAVEELLHPDLIGKPFAVGGRPEERGVVSSCSYPARLYGIHSAMPMSRALGIYPKLIIIPGHYRVYQDASVRVMDVLGRFTPLVEQISIDEAFLDVSDMPESGLDIARDLQKEIHQETNLPCSLGVAVNKLVAKMATDYGKASHRTGTYPNAIQVVSPGQEAAFLATLPTQALWGIGPKTAARLSSIGIHTIGELAVMPDPVLKRLFGRLGYELGRHARGIDDRSVGVDHSVKSISQEITFERDITNQVVLEDTLWTLAEQVGQRLRSQGYCGTTIRLKLRWPDFATPTRQLTLNQPTDLDDLIYKVALELFKSLWQPGKSVRLLGVGVSGLGQRMYQPGLWDTQSAKERKLLVVMDDLKKRFGEQVIQRGRNIKRKR